MENTLENKSKFFALYYGQEVLTRDDGFRKFWMLGSEVSIESSLSKYGYDYGYYLELTPLSQITDEDAIEVCKCMNWDRVLPPNIEGHPLDFSVSIFDFNWVKNKSFEWSKINLHTAGYLRSKGYALPWMGLSVEQLIEFGWIKLKEN